MALFEMKPGHGKHDFRHRDGHRELLVAGGRVECDPEELGGALNKFVRLDPELPRELPKEGLKIIHRGGGWFDVINSATGKRLNDEALRKGDAYGLIMDVTGVDASALGDIDAQAGAAVESVDSPTQDPTDGVQMIDVGPHLNGGFGA